MVDVKALVLAISLSVTAFSAEADLAIYHIDVNMGDATLIVETTARKALLVDAGNRGYGKKAVAPMLKTLGYSNIDYFITTHYDSDHIGGFDELAKAGITIKTVFDRGDYTHRKKKTKKNNLTQYGEYLMQAEKVQRITLLPTCNKNQKTIKLGKAKIRIVASRGKYLTKDCKVEEKKIRKRRDGQMVDVSIAENKDNDLSIATVIEYGNFSYFIGGDLTGGGNNTTDMETEIIPVVGDIDVLKLSHHGSKTSSNINFLRATSPEVVVISVGDGGVNKGYRLPRQEVLDRVASLDSQPKVYSTHKGEDGTLPDQIIADSHIVIHTDGRSYTVNGTAYTVDERKVD